MHQAMQGGIAWRPIGAVAELQHVFGRILRVEPEMMHGPRLDPVDARAGGERVLRRLVEVMHGGLDPVATGNMNPLAVLQARNGFLALPL